MSGGYRIRPYASKNLAPEGSNGEGRKSVKKRAALLHVLAFCCFDLLFGVLRGERLAAKPMAASLLRKPARVVIRPAGANIARSPVSLRSTVAPCSQPRNPLRRASRAIASSGHLFRFLFGCPKRKDWRGNDAIKGDTAGWCPRQAQAAKISSLLFPLHPL